MKDEQPKQPKIYVVSDEAKSAVNSAQYGIQIKYPTAAKKFNKPAAPIETATIDNLQDSQNTDSIAASAKLEQFTFYSTFAQEAVAKLKSEHGIESPLIIMFANGFTPGGAGEESSAQEENILLRSNAVYFMPKNYGRGLNIDLGGIYAIWDADITYTSKNTTDTNKPGQYFANLAFIAMPNLNHPLQNLKTPQDEEYAGSENRAAYLRHVISTVILQFHVAKKSGNVMIAGRQGCGVFQNDDEDISAIIYAVSQLDMFKDVKVVYALGRNSDTNTIGNNTRITNEIYKNPLDTKITEANNCIADLKKDLGDDLELKAVSQDLTQKYLESKLYYPETKNKIETQFPDVLLDPPAIINKEGLLIRLLRFKKEANINAIVDWLFTLGISSVSDPDKKLSPQKQQDGSWTLVLSKAQLKLLKCTPQQANANSSSSSSISQSAFFHDELEKIKKHIKELDGLFSSLSYGDDANKAKHAFKMILKLNQSGYSRQDISNYIHSEYLIYFVTQKTINLFNPFLSKITSHTSSTAETKTIPTNTAVTEIDLETAFKKISKNSHSDQNNETEINIFQTLFKKNNPELFNQLKATAIIFINKPSLETEKTFFDVIINLATHLPWTKQLSPSDQNEFFDAILKFVIENNLRIPQIREIYNRINFLKKSIEDLSEICDVDNISSTKQEEMHKETAEITFKTSVLTILKSFHPISQQAMIVKNDLRKQIDALKQSDNDNQITKIKAKISAFFDTGQFLYGEKVEEFIKTISVEIETLLKNINNPDIKQPDFDQMRALIQIETSAEKLKEFINNKIKNNSTSNADLKIDDIHITETVNGPIYFLNINDETQAKKISYRLSQLGIVMRSNPKNPKSCQKIEGKNIWAISLTQGQLELLKFELNANSTSTSHSYNKAFSEKDIKNINAYITKLEAKKKSEENTPVELLSFINSSTNYDLQKNIKDEKINAFNLILKLNEIGYSRQVILDYIKSDYEKAILDNDGKKLFDSLQPPKEAIPNPVPTTTSTTSSTAASESSSSTTSTSSTSSSSFSSTITTQTQLIWSNASSSSPMVFTPALETTSEPLSNVENTQQDHANDSVSRPELKDTQNETAGFNNT